MKITEQIVDRQIINGKPHFGIWIRRFVILDSSFISEPYLECPLIKECIEKLKYLNEKYLEFRNISFIYRRPSSVDILNYKNTLGMKAVLWGRAFKVMKTLKKGSKKYKKVYRAGKRKRVRVL